MSPLVPLTYYCLLILAVSIAGGMIPIWFRLTHRGMECAVSFVAGVMLGVGMLHMLPHALQLASADGSRNLNIMIWVLLGLLTMFFIERFFCFHHHDVEDGEVACHHDEHHHGHDITWSGAALGLTLHSIIAGVALAAGVYDAHDGMPLAGLGTFLVIVLHKPFDSMTIATLMARGGWSLSWRHAVNGLFSLAIPLGAAIFYLGMSRSAAPEDAAGSLTVGYALAFAAGTFLCIALSDLLPELQFHDHDRVKLSLALVLGLGLAYGVCQLESLAPTHSHGVADTTSITQFAPVGRGGLGRAAVLQPVDDPPIEPAEVRVAVAAAEKTKMPAVGSGHQLD